MSWIEVIDTQHGHTVLDLQPTVLEVFRTSVAGSTRIHLRVLQIEMQGQDPSGSHRVGLTVLGGTGGTVVTVDEPTWMRLWPWIEQVRQAQGRAVGQVAGQGLPPGYAPPPGHYGPPPTMGVVDP